MAPTVPVELGAATSSAPKLFCGPPFAAEPAQRLKYLIDGLQFEEAQSLNAAMAEEMAIEWNGEGRIEWWFLKQIEVAWGQPAREQAQRAWANARKEATERLAALSARLEAAKPNFAEAKGKLTDLGTRLAALKPKIEEAKAKLAVIWEQRTPDGSPVLSKSAPMDNAKQFAKDQLQFRAGDKSALGTYHWRKDWWQWNGSYYELAPRQRISDKVYFYLDGAQIGQGNDLQRFRPKPRRYPLKLKREAKGK